MIAPHTNLSMGCFVDVFRGLAFHNVMGMFHIYLFYQFCSFCPCWLTYYGGIGFRVWTSVSRVLLGLVKLNIAFNAFHRIIVAGSWDIEFPRTNIDGSFFGCCMV